jgi:hypothetical protein
MATASSASCVAQIGKTAGAVWKILADNGPMTMAKLVKTAGSSRDLVMQAVGWLAREDKVNIEEERHSRIVSLR